MAIRKSIQQYQVNSVNNILDADPHTLITIIYQHVLGNLAAAKGAIVRQDIEEKNKCINTTIGLIGELLNSLNMENGGEISKNLAGLYHYSLQKINEAHYSNQVDFLNEISMIFIDIKSGWDSIPNEYRSHVDANKVVTGT